MASQRTLPGHGLALAILAGILLVWLLLMVVVTRDAFLPPEADGTVIVVFPPAYDRNASLSAIIRADGLLVRETLFDNVWVVHRQGAGFAGALQREGAMAVLPSLAFRPVVVQGCFL